MNSPLARLLIADPPSPEEDAARQHQLEARAWHRRGWLVIRPEDRARMPRLMAMAIERLARERFGT